MDGKWVSQEFVLTIRVPSDFAVPGSFHGFPIEEQLVSYLVRRDISIIGRLACRIVAEVFNQFPCLSATVFHNSLFEEAMPLFSSCL